MFQMFTVGEIAIDSPHANAGNCNLSINKRICSSLRDIGCQP